MTSFTVNLDNAKLTKDIQDAVTDRITIEKNKIIGNLINELFTAPSFYNKKGGVMHQLLREQIEAIALERVAAIDVDKIRADFDEVFMGFYNEHLPPAIERVARREAHRAAESAAKNRVKQ